MLTWVVFTFLYSLSETIMRRQCAVRLCGMWAGVINLQRPAQADVQQVPYSYTSLVGLTAKALNPL